VCVLGPYEYDAAEWPEAGPVLVDTDRVSTELIQINDAVRFGQFYLEDLRAAANVRVCLWANAVELVTDGSGERVAHVDVATLTGVRYAVSARAVVLATGGIEVPRLLLASNGTRRAGLGNEHDLVGRHFTEHLQVPIAVAALDRSADELRLYDQPTFPNPERPDREMALKGVLSLTPDVMRDEELLGLDVQFSFGPLPDGAPPQAGGVDAAASAALLAAAERRATPTVAVLVAVGEQAVDPDSRVRLSPTRRDALGLPEVELDWHYGEQDRASMVAGLGIMAAELARLGVGRVQLLPGALVPNPDVDFAGPVTGFVAVDPRAVDPEGFPFGVGFHHMCTTRMDPDPERGVVDVDCRVHSVENLYVAGSAVFPTGGVAPPTLTIVALALRLADHLERELA
jgi:choline dehydrogenase-like flavoprotein